MRTVDVAEQLLAIGRRLQAMERRLTQPPPVLELPLVFQQLLVDPLARLGDLVRPFANWPPPQQAPDVPTPSSTLMHRWPPASQPPIAPPAGRPPPVAAAAPGRGEARWSG